MERLHVEKVNELYIRVQADPSTKMELSGYFEFFVPGYKFMPSYRNKVWDGKIRLFNAMTGMVYAGLAPYIAKFADERGYEVTFDKELAEEENVPDNTGYMLAKEFDSAFEPRDYQNDAITLAIRRNRGLFLSPTASGKSFIIYLLARYHVQAYSRKVLVIVPTTSLVTQMASDFVEYNKNRPLDIHKIMAGADKNVDANYTVTTWQSVYKMSKAWFEQFDVVIVDEAHLAKAKSITGIMEKMPDTKYRYGFTGTLDDTQTHKLVLEGLFGKVYQVTQTKKLIDDKTLAGFDIKAIVLQYPTNLRKSIKGSKYQDEIDFIVRNEARNKFIRNLAWNLKGNTLILFQFVEKHGKVLEPILQKDGKTVHFIHGGVDAENREAVRGITESSDNNIILASYGTFSTGVNIKRLDNVIFASPSKSKIRNLQSIGRVLRKGNGKENATLYDIVDDLQIGTHKNYAVQHFIERVRIYSNESFEYKIYNVDLKE